MERFLLHKRGCGLIFIFERRPEAERDRFGRYVNGFYVERNALRELAMQYKVGGSFDAQEQAGKVARAILKKSNEAAQ